MSDLASQKAIGPKPDAGFQAAVAKKNYKSKPENSDYWDRVVQVPSAKGPRDDGPKRGAYSDPKAQRMMNGLNTDPKNEPGPK